MEGTPQLLTDVKFSQHRRGYDPDEVDNFLERVSAAVAQLQDKLRQATERAEMADSQVAEARRLQAEAEAAARAAGAGGDVAPGPALDADEELKKVLLLAQRAADQAVAEANTTATKTVADARAKALALLAEAEAERDRMMEKARKKADATVEQRAQELRDQVGRPGGGEDRPRSRREPPSTRTWPTRPLGCWPPSTPSVRPSTTPGACAWPRPRRSTTPRCRCSRAWTSPSSRPAPASRAAPRSSTSRKARSTATTSPPWASTPASRPRSTPSVAGSTESAPDVPAAAADEERYRDGIDGLDLDIDLTGTEGADGTPGSGGHGEGRPTELFTPAPDPVPVAESSALGEPDAAADAAMRAFFEQDLDEDPTTTTPRPRFGRRR